MMNEYISFLQNCFLRLTLTLRSRQRMRLKNSHVTVRRLLSSLNLLTKIFSRAIYFPKFPLFTLIGMVKFN